MFDTNTTNTTPTPCPGIIDILFAAADTPVPTQRILYDRKGAAATLSIATTTLDYATANGLIDFVRHGSKVMYLHSALVKFARTNHSSLCSVEVAD